MTEFKSKLITSKNLLIIGAIIFFLGLIMSANEVSKKDIGGKAPSWNIGESITKGNFEYTINWVKTFPKWVYRKDKSISGGYDYYKWEPKEGFKFVLVNMSAKNIGKEKDTPEYWSMEVKTTDGVIYKELESKPEEGMWGSLATQEEAEKYYCKNWNAWNIESIYPQESVTACEGIGIHQEKDPAEIWIYFGPFKEKPDYIIKLK